MFFANSILFFRKSFEKLFWKKLLKQLFLKNLLKTICWENSWKNLLKKSFKEKLFKKIFGEQSIEKSFETNLLGKSFGKIFWTTYFELHPLNKNLVEKFLKILWIKFLKKIFWKKTFENHLENLSKTMFGKIRLKNFLKTYFEKRILGGIFWKTQSFEKTSLENFWKNHLNANLLKRLSRNKIWDKKLKQNH